MKAADLPANEAERLRSLRELEQLDTPADQVLDAITNLAASICGVPIALISLVDESRQWFKSAVGLGAKETPRELAFCAHAILTPTVLMEVQDAAEDPRFHDNPLVTGEPRIRFYAGMPLTDDGGLGLGTLCVIDRAPRQLSQQQAKQLRDLASIAVHLLQTTRTRHTLGEVSTALRRAEAQFRLMFENAPIGMTLFGLDGRFIRANQQFYRLIGYDESELRDLTFTELTHPNDRAEDLKLARAVLSGLQSHARRRKRYVRKDGSTVHVDVHVSPMSDDSGLKTGFIAQVIDVSAELVAEARLRESEAQLSALIESVPDAIMSVDRQGRLTTFNKRVADDVRRTHGVSVERGMSVFDLGDQRTRDAAVENHRRCLQGESIHFEWGIKTNDAKTLHLLMSHTPMISNGEIFGAAIVAKDITTRREMEVALVRKNREIELLRAIATTANESLTTDAAIARTLELVARFAQWAVGHFITVVAGQPMSQKIWYLRDAAKFARFRDESESLRFCVDSGLPGRVLEAHRPCRMASLPDNPEFLRAAVAKESELRSAFAFPIFAGSEIVAIVEFFSEYDEQSDEELDELFENIGRQVGRVIERERHATEVRALSLTDELTGLYNRRGFVTLASQQLLVNARSESSGALFSVDLDGLKRVNDHLGHEAGDEVISSFASVLRQTFRGADIVARLGGDEFIVLMTSSGDRSHTVLARLAQNIEKQNATRPSSIALSASIGVVEVPPNNADSLEVLLARADSLMYENKRARRSNKGDAKQG